MEQRVEHTQRQEQRLALTPQIRLGLQILQMPLPELQQFVEQQVQENPVLEETSASSLSTPLASVGPHEASGRVDVALVEQLEQDDEPKTLVEQEEGQHDHRIIASTMASFNTDNGQAPVLDKREGRGGRDRKGVVKEFHQKAGSGVEKGGTTSR